MTPPLLPIGLGLLAFALAGTVLLEVSGGMPDSDAVIPLRATIAGPAPPRLAGRDPGQVQAWAAAALARPLFSPTRRPAPATAVNAAAPAAAVLPRMTGTLVSPSARRAIFVGADGKSVVVPEGGQLGPFTVTAVRAGQAVVSGPGGERTLSPAFDRNAPRPAAAAEPPSVAGDLPGLPGFKLDPGAGGGIPGLTAPNPPPPAR